MRRVLVLGGRVVLALTLAAAIVGITKRDELRRLWTVNTIFEPDRIVDNFSNMDRAFLHVSLDASETHTPLPTGQAMELPEGFDVWITERFATSIVILKDGQLVHESYHLETQPEDLRIGWSLSKSFISALTGILLEEGKISDLDDQVITYAPSLSGGAYDSATVRNVLNMATGVTFDEDYTDYDSDINRMGRVLALGGLMDDFATGLSETFIEPGVDWQYCSIDTHVLGMVIRGATGRSVPDLMQDRILSPLGMEKPAYYLTDGAGVAFVLGGLNMTSRDFARFGQMIMQGGVWKDEQIVPRDWIVASTTASAPTQPDEMGYGFQWWMPRDAKPREYMGRGIYGQYLYIDELSGVVIVLTAADPDFRDRDIQRENINMFRRIAASLNEV
ncbi:MAG: serine hydrolase [Pseudomonadota bacterium]